MATERHKNTKAILCLMSLFAAKIALGRRRLMRAERSKRKGTFFAALVLMGACTLLLLKVQRSAFERPGSPRLVSIEPLPDYGAMCAPEPAGHGSSMIAALEENNLFAALEDQPVHAASPEAGDTADVTRPPVRTIKDTYPIYSSVAVDSQRDEVVLQDTN